MLTNDDFVCYKEKEKMCIADFEQDTLTSRFLLQSKEIDDLCEETDIVEELNNVFSIQPASVKSKKSHTRANQRHSGTKKNQYK
jgi:hypothetical protein